MTKTLTELRTIAQGLGVKDITSLTRAVLEQEIKSKSTALAGEKLVIPEIVIKQVANTSYCDEAELLEVLQPYIQRGLKVSIIDNMWRFSSGAKCDTGTMTMPIRTALRKAQEILS